MKRILRIFLLNLQTIFEIKSRSLVWFLVALINPLVLILFWRGALTGNQDFNGWNFTSLASYYFLLMPLGSMIMSHVEETIAEVDVKQGGLANFITKPFSYYWLRFFGSFPYQALQAFFGVCIIALSFVFIPGLVVLTNDPVLILTSFLICILAIILAYTFKIIIGLFSLWFIDIGGFLQLVGILVLIFAGFLLPLDLLPQSLSKIAKALPTAYMIYYPVSAVAGKLSFPASINVLLTQVVWIAVLGVIYKLTWRAGIKRFTGVGQ